MAKPFDLAQGSLADTRVSSGQQPSEIVSSAYPAVPADLSHLWLVPDAAFKARVPRALTQFAEGVRLEADGKFARALPLFTAAAASTTVLADYASYHKGIVLLRLGRVDEGRKTLETLRGKELTGYLWEAVRLAAAEAAQSAGDTPACVQIYEELTTRKTASPDAVLMSLGKAAAASGDRVRAAKAYTKLFYDYPLSDQASVAAAELEALRDIAAVDPATHYKMDVTRAQRLFDARRYAIVEPAYRDLMQQAATADDKEKFSLRIAECEYYLRHYKEARDLAQPFIENASRRAEALFFYLSSVRELGTQDEYVRLADRMSSEYPTSSWTEETLNNLASYHIVNNDDEQADKVFRDLYSKFPKGKYAERAAWKIGWWAYKHQRYAETVKFFESTALAFPHSDYRPSYIYWSARAHESLGERQVADARFRVVLTDYRNTYYGRLAAAHLKARDGDYPDIEPVALLADDQIEGFDTTLPPNAEQTRTLLAVGLVDQAMDELQWAQRNSGDSRPVAATIAWVLNQRGDFRAGITAMKRAYPQYMAAGGDLLPVEIRKVMYPVAFWPEIRKEATARKLDPYLVAALILQESSFAPDARSAANAVGLMQIVAPTGRQYARSLRIRRFSAGMLTRPQTNLKLGVAYFADLVRRFGAEHFALASYNAGEHRVSAWMAERPGLSREEFIDDIPFPETQNYVKRIIGTADDYRLIYGDKATAAKAGASKPPKKKPAVKKVSAKKGSSKKAARKKTRA